MAPLFPDAQRSLCPTWGPLPTLWHPAGSPRCPATRVFSVPLCSGPLMRWPAERATACQHLRTCLAAWETCPTSTGDPHSPSSQTWAPCLRTETLPDITTPLNLTMTTTSTSSSDSPGGSRTAFLRTLDTMSTMNTTSKDFHDSTHHQLQADPLQVNMKCFYWLRYFSVTGKETKGCDSWEKKRVQNVTKIRKCILELHTWFWKVHGSQSSTLKGLKLSFIAFCLQILSYESGAVVFTDEWNHTSRSFQICLFGRMLRSKWLLLWNDKVWWMGFGPYIGHFERNASMTLSVSKEHFNFSFFFFKFSFNIFILLLHIVNTSMV